MRLNDFNNLTNFGIEDPRMTTIGGVAFRHLDRLPRVGDQVTVEGITITILEMDEHRIDRVRVSRGEGAEEAAIGDQPEMDESVEAATAGVAAIEPGGQERAADAGGEDSLPAGNQVEDAADDAAGQKVPAETASRSDAAYAASEPGSEDSRPDRKNKALN
jgi:hypothetical protein